MREHDPGDHLSALIRSGNRDKIARELEPLVRRMVTSVLRTSDRDLIETATSDTLLAVCRYHATFQGRSRPTTWLYTIARREALRVLRTSFTFVSLEEHTGADALARLSTTPHVSVASDAWIDLQIAIPRPEWRRVWLLANAPSPRRSLSEVARLAGYTQGSVTVILSRIRRALEGHATSPGYPS